MYIFAFGNIYALRVLKYLTFRGKGVGREKEEERGVEEEEGEKKKKTHKTKKKSQ